MTPEQKAIKTIQSIKPNPQSKRYAGNGITWAVGGQNIRFAYESTLRNHIISTIQRMYSILRTEELDESAEEGKS